VNPYGGFPLWLSSLTNGSPSGMTLRARDSHPTQPDVDKGAQVPLVSQRKPDKWRPSGMVWNGSAPYRSAQRCDGSGTEVMIASPPTTSAAVTTH
jgi:hypothetical protein